MRTGEPAKPTGVDSKLAIEFLCSQCQCELRVGENAIGKKARCPQCGMIHDVPTESVISSTPDASESVRWGNSDIDQETVYRSPESMLPFQAHAMAEDNIGNDSSNTSTDPLQIPDGGGLWSMKTPDGQVYGPVSQEELDSWSEQGRVSSACLVKMDGQSHWQSALVLYPHLTAAQPTSGSESTVRQHYERTGRYPDRGVGVGGSRTVNQQTVTTTPRPSNGGTVLALAIVSLFFVFFPIFGIAAFWIGRAEIKAIERGEATREGRAMLDIGYAISILSLAISFVMFIGCCVVSSSI